jgi:hypothetical protein
MRFKATWILIAIFAALVGYLYLVDEPQQQANREAGEKEGLVFPDLDVDRVTEITLAGKRGLARATKGEDGKWFLVEPWDDRADDGRVRRLLADLKTLKTDREVAGPGADLEGYGLTEPEVTLVTSGEAVKLLVGAANPAGDARYVRAGDGPVQLAKSQGLTGFFLSPGDLRNKELLGAFPWDRLASLEIRSPEGETIRLVKSERTWRLEEPVRAEVNPDAAQRVTEKLRWAKVKRFLDRNREEADEKLSGGTSVTLGAAGEEPPITLRMAEVEGVVWADRSGRDGLFTVSADLLQTCQLEAGDLRRKRPVLVKPWKVKRLEIELEGAAVVYEKVDGIWQRGGATLGEIDAAALAEYLRNLETGVAEQVIDEPGPAADHGLEEPELVARIVDTEGQHELIVGRTGEKVYARGSESGPVYEMSADYLDQARRLVASTTNGDEKEVENTGSSAASE